MPNNNNGLKVIYKNKEYKSISSACKSLDLNASTIKSRMNKFGLSFEEAVNYNRSSNSKHTVSYHGKTYSSVKSACKLLGLTSTTIRNRMAKYNMSFEDAVDNYGKFVEYRGTYYRSIKELCDALKIDVSRVRSFVRRGLSLEEAVDTVKNNDNRIKVIEYNGLVYKSLREACTKEGLDYIKTKQTMNRNNDSFKSLVIEKLFEQYKGYYIVENERTPIHTKEGIFHICTCKKCGVRSIVRADMMKEHIDSYHSINKGEVICQA